MRTVLAVAGVLSVVSLAAFAQDEKTKPEDTARLKTETVIVPDGTQPFTIEKSQVVRLTGEGIAGAEITAAVEGPAKITWIANVVHLVDGKAPLGTSSKEFEITPTGKGMVVVKIAVKNPTGEEPNVTEYRFTVE